MTLRAIIFRGVPGSGKSTAARKLAGDTGVIHSTDDYFTTNGHFHFRPEELADAHSWNRYLFKQSIEKKIPIVICDNTNVRRAEFTWYIEAATKAGYEVEVIALPHPDPEVAARRTIHGVPLAKIQKMIAAWEP